MTEPLAPIEGTTLPVAERADYVVNCLRDHIGVVDAGDTVVLLDSPIIPLYHKKTGELVGYETYVRLFDETGDLGVDAHRQFINPPDGRRKLDDGTVVEDVDPTLLVEDILRRTVKP